MEQKGALKRIIPVVLVFVAILLIALVFSGTRKDVKYQTISNPNDAFATIGKQEITNQEMYNNLLHTYGVSTMTDELNKIIVSDYIDASKNDPRFDINKEYEKAIYKGLTKEEASKVYSSEDIKNFEVSFKETIAINNLDEASFKELMYINHAKELYTEAKIKEAYNNGEYAVRAVKAQFENQFYDNTDLILLSFDTTSEAVKTLSEVGVTVTKDGLNRNYYLDGKLIDANSEFYPTDEETLKGLKLSDAEVKELFVELNNLLNPDKVSLVDGQILNAKTYTFDDLTKISFYLTDYAFQSLNTETNPYSTALVEFPIKNFGAENEVRRTFFVYKVSGDNRNDFKETFAKEMGEDEFKALLKEDANEFKPENISLYNEVVDDLIYTDSKNVNIQDKYLNKAITEDLKLNVNDSRLYGLLTANTKLKLTDNKTNDDAVYSYTLNGNQVLVSADEFYNDLLSLYGANKLISLANAKVFVSDEKLVKETITSDMENYFKTSIQNYKQAFISGQYQEYGYTTSTKTWEEFMFEVLGATSEKDLYNQMVTEFMANAYLVNEFRVNNKEQAYKDMQEYYNEWFNVDTRHILVYADTNNDGTPDRTMSNEVQTKAYKLATILNEKILKAENFTVNMFSNLVKEYNEASIKDPVYGEFKLAGLELTTEKIDNVSSTSNLEENFLVEAKKLNDELLNSTKKYVLSEKPVKSSYGYHILYAESADKKLDAYPEDASLTFPTMEDIDKYYNGDKSLSKDVTDFITSYYSKALEKRVNAESTVLLDEVRDEMGLTISNKDVEAHYNEIVAVHKASNKR